MRPNARCKIFTSHTRHHLVQKDDVVRLAPMPCALKFSQRLEPVCDALNFDAISIELATEYFKVHFDVVDHKNLQILEMRRQTARVRNLDAGTSERQLEPEC